MQRELSSGSLKELRRNTMQRSQSGAAQVSFLWIVFLIVLVLFLAGFTYIAWKDKGEMEQSRQDAIAKADQSRNQAIAADTKIQELSVLVGFRDESVVGSSSDKEAIGERLDMLKGKFPDHVSADTQNLEVVINDVVAYGDKMKRDFDEKAATLESEIATRREAQDSLTTIEQNKNTRIQELEAQLSDEQQRSATQKEEDNQRIANLQSQLDDLNSRIRDVESSAELEKQVADKEISTLNARILALSKKLEVLDEPDIPDGQIIATSTKSGLAYIDIGGRDGLRRGTKFDVYRYSKGGELVLKGSIEVRDVETESSMCGITKELFELDPIVKGDVVVNPLYSRNMERTFVLLGRFPATLNRTFIGERLAALGNAVEDKVSSRTDFLVLGDKEQGEFAPELTETDEYKLADKLGVQIVRLNEIWDFIKY